jgi:hypothetical protein
MPRPRKPDAREAARNARARATKPPAPARRRAGLIEKVDRLAQRPFLEGDYQPGAVRPRGPEGECDAGPRRPRR